MSCTIRTNSELQSLLYGPRQNEKRETLFEDRTHCHADHAEQGMERETTAAVGVLKAVRFEEKDEEEESRVEHGYVRGREGGRGGEGAEGKAEKEWYICLPRTRAA